MSGVLGCVSAMIAMTAMYPGRVARFDLLSTIGFLAKRITRSDRECDRRLHRLMCYVMTTADEISVGWIGEDPSALMAHLFARKLCRVSIHVEVYKRGCRFHIQGPSSRSPIAASCASHTSVAQSSTGSEVASLDAAMKTEENQHSVCYLLY